MNRRALAFAFGAICFWSSNAVVAKFTLRGLAVEQVQFLQFVGATAVFFLISRVGRSSDKTTGTARSPGGRVGVFALTLGLIGLCGTMVFQYLAFAAGPIAQVNLIAYSWPLLSAVLVIAMGASRHPFRLFLISLIGFIGVSLLISGGSETDWSDTNLWGICAATLSALCMAVYTVAIGRTGCSSAALLLPASLTGLAGTLVWCLLKGAPWAAPELIPLGLYLGAGPMGLGYLLWTAALRHDNAGRVAIFGYATPVLSTLWLLISGEHLTTAMAIGGVLVIASCTLIGTRLNNVSASARRA